MPDNLASHDSLFLNSQGWDNCVDSDLIQSSDYLPEHPSWKSHAHTLRKLFEELGMDFILCVEGRPTACVISNNKLTDSDILELRSNLWNLGTTTLLIVERNTEVQVFSTFSTPKQNQALNTVQLSDETINNFESVALALRLTQLIRKIETGAIYRDYRPLFKSESVVDQLLLSNLRELRNQLSPIPSIQALQRAHALIGKFLFCCYLIDRGIVGKNYLTKKKLPEVDGIYQLMGSSDKESADNLNRLFEALQGDFNGSIFGHQEMLVKAKEIKFFRRLIASEDLSSGQLSLFKLYDFSFIPVELISSIYQEFLSTEEEAKDTSNLKKTKANNGQRIAGAYYTPPRLAELTVDIATEGWTTLLDKRCLDGACGSGVFLVILFIRMSEEWRNRNPNASTQERYDFLKSLLANNLVGSDINGTACLVTCFSLYLALLDQMDPKEIHDLREALKKHGNAKVLPRIFWEKSEDRPQAPRLCTVRETDFFKLDEKEKFDLVIGNPPWVSRKPAPEVESWILSEQLNPAAIGVAKSVLNSTLFPAKEQTCGFMWKSSLHTMDSGRVCQVLPSRVFLSSNTNKFQAHWIKRHRLESVWLLADYRFILFPGADCPCFVTRYHPRNEDEELGEFEYITPKVEISDPREATISISNDDQKTISEKDVVSMALDDRAAITWKKTYWGTPRDTQLIDRLMKFPKLKRLTYSPGRGQKVDGVRRWARGQGFQPACSTTKKPAPVFWQPTDRFLSTSESSASLMLIPSDTSKVGNLHKEKGLHRALSKSHSLFEAPLLLVNQACTKFLFSDFDVLFQDSFQAISGPIEDKGHLLLATAILASPLTQYWLFHTTANIGIERDKAHFEELLDIPFALPTEMPNPKSAQKIADECAGILTDLKESLKTANLLTDKDALVNSAQAKLNKRVLKYFDISPWEQSLIEDTVSIFRPSSTPSSLVSAKLLTAQKSTSSHRAVYADEFRNTFRSWSQTTTGIQTSVSFANESNLAIFTFEVSNGPDSHDDKPASKQVEKIISKLRTATTNDSVGSVFQKMRGFIYFDGPNVHILKTMALRSWTKTAALNDADSIMRIMMEEDGWGA